LAFNLVIAALACAAASAVIVSSYKVINTYTFDEIIEFWMTGIRTRRTNCSRPKNQSIESQYEKNDPFPERHSRSRYRRRCTSAGLC
jgi:hypothetical protein